MSPIMREVFSSSGERMLKVSLPKSSPPSLQQNFEFTKKNLEPMLEQMKKFYKTFSDDYSFYHDYMHDTFLRDVVRYYASTTDYVGWVLRGQDYGTYLAARLASAFKMIKYLEDDELIDKTFPTIEEFIKKWKDWELKQDVFPHSSMFKNQ